MMNHRMIADGGLKAMPGGCSIGVRVPWYRSLPLSVFEVMSVEIDGTSVPLDRIAFDLEGKRLGLDELRARTGDVWYVLDTAHLVIDGTAIEVGKAYDLVVTIAIYPPYIKGYKRITRTDKRLTAH